MISKPTVFILGAGGSMMYGFPSGRELKDLVIRLYRKEGPALNKHREAMGLDEYLVKKFCVDLSQSGVSSVDAFLEHRKEYLDIGKTAIAEALIPFEDEAKLFPKESDWYGYLLDNLNTPLDRFIENQLTILTFNYDRSLEWYMFKALRARFGLNEDRALELVGMIPVIHLYGTLGGLPWENNGRPYHSFNDRPEIYLARDKIKIIHEDVGKDKEFEKALVALSTAKRIVILGFGYNGVNIGRLRPARWAFCDHPIRGSAYGMTEQEKAYAKKVIGHAMSFGNTDWDLLRFLREKVALESL